MTDLIIISCGKNGLDQITRNALISLKNSEDFKFNVIVVESEPIYYEDCLTIHPKEKFNYNKFINIGLSYCKNEIVSFCNNDLIFHKNWMSSHIEIFKNHPKIESLSPKCNFWKNGQKYEKHSNFSKGIYFGSRSGYELTGWCITVKRSLLNKIGNLDTTTSFWYSDNTYSMQLNKNRIIHALNADSLVTHLFGKSQILLNTSELNDMTIGQKKFFIKSINIKNL